MLQLKELIESHYPGFASKPGILTNPTVALLRRMLREQEVNAFLAQNAGLDGLEFVERVLEHFDFSFSVVGREKENIPCEGRVVIVANHPLGLLDGAALLKLVSEVRRDVRIVASDVLGQFEPIRDVVLPVVNIGRGSNKANVAAIHAALERDEAVIFFPSGEVSRAGPTGIRDGRWHAGFLRFAERARAPILPVHLEGRNSALFYGVSAMFKPISTFMLFGEAYKQRATALPVRVGELIAWRDIEALALTREQKVRHISRQVYAIGRNRVLPFRTQKAIAHPEDRVAVRRELQGTELLARTGDGKQIFLFDGRTGSAVMRELGRLREVAFRQVGEGTGKRRDIDAFDAHYRHVLLWDDQELQVVGAYRIGRVADILATRGPEGLYTYQLFSYGDGMLGAFGRSLELGRSFVQPRYWGLRGLDCLWQGIGAYLRRHPEVRYLFGPVSLSAALPDAARKLLVHFYGLHFGGRPGMASARIPYEVAPAEREAFSSIVAGDDYERDFRAMKRRLAEMGASVPTLYKQYTELCEPGGTTFLAFGLDPGFGGCVDGLVMVDLERMRPAKRERYLGAGNAASGAGAQSLLRSA